MIPFRCSCGRQLQARDEHAGKRVQCPACSAVVVVPGGEAAVQPEPESPPPNPRVQQRPQRPDTSPAPDDFEDFDDKPSSRDTSEKKASTSGKAVFSLILGLLSFLCLCPVTSLLLGLPASLLGFMAMGDVNRSRGRVKGKGLAIFGMVTGALGMFVCTPVEGYLAYMGYSAYGNTRSRIAATNDLKQIGLAIHNYHDTFRALPPANLADAQGMPGRPPRSGGQLSWRVAILPYIEQENLYKQFNLNESWDSPTNKALIPRMPKTYQLPGFEKEAAEGKTFYQVFVGRGTMFEKGQKIHLHRITDGTSNTLMVVEAAEPVIWTKPDDLQFDPSGTVPRLGGHYGNIYLGLLGDGSVRTFKIDEPASTVRARITRDGGEVVPFR